MAVLAVVFDFDDTLAPDSTSKLLKQHGIDPSDFWSRLARERILSGFEPALAYLSLVLDLIGPDLPLGLLSNQRLRGFGASLDQDSFPGLPQLFDDLQEIVSGHRDVSLEFYVVSGGLEEIIRGSSVVAKYFSGVYGCRLGSADGTETGQLKYVKRCVTFTEKTRYLFEINKGLTQAETDKNPLLVNSEVANDARRVPFQNMIYVGDGLTDIPCFSLVASLGGLAFGVFDPRRTEKAKQTLQELLKPKRVISSHAPKYGEEDELGSLLRAAVANRAAQVVVESATAMRS